MVERREAFLGELFRNHDGAEAVVEEAGVVAAILHRPVVGVHDVQIQPIASRVLSQDNHEAVRTVLVHVVVEVDAVARQLAVTDHVHLDHADHLLVGLLRDNVRVGVAAVETLFLAREVAEPHGVVRVHLRQRDGTFHHADGAGGIVVRTRSELLVGPRPASGRVEVTTDVEHVLRRDLAGLLSDQVVVGLAAHLVHVTLGLETHAGVERLEMLDGQLDVAVVAVAGHKLDLLATNRDGQFARELLDGSFDAALLHGSQNGSNLRIGRGVAGFDARTLLVGGATNFLCVEFAGEAIAVLVVRVVMSLALVDGAQRSGFIGLAIRENNRDASQKKQGDGPQNVEVKHGRPLSW